MLPLASMFRKKDIDNIITISKKNNFHHFRDIYLYYYLFKINTGVSLNHFMGVYRWHESGISSMKTEEEHLLDYYLIYGELYRKNKNDEILRKAYLNIIYQIFNNKANVNNLLAFYFGLCICKSKMDYSNLFLNIQIRYPIFSRLTKYKFIEYAINKCYNGIYHITSKVKK